MNTPTNPGVTRWSHLVTPGIHARSTRRPAVSNRDMHRDLTGTRWIRKRDGASFTVLTDTSAPATTNRSIRMRNETTGRAFLATPEGLGRKYRPQVETYPATNPQEL